MATFLSWTWTQEKLFELALVQFPEGSPYFLENISQFLQKPIAEVKYYYDALVNDIELIESGEVALPNYPEEDDYLPFKEEYIPKRKEPARKRGTPWTTEEHELFLIGLDKYGKGDWKSISRECVKTRTSTQIASHAQKYFLRQKSDSKERKRSSIHDITLKNHSDDVTNVPDGSSSQSVDQQQQSVEESDPDWIDCVSIFEDVDDASFLL